MWWKYPQKVVFPHKRVREPIAWRDVATLHSVGRASYILKICKDGLKTAGWRSFARKGGEMERKGTFLKTCFRGK
jgi:hypothetical protein